MSSSSSPSDPSSSPFLVAGANNDCEVVEGFPNNEVELEPNKGVLVLPKRDVVAPPPEVLFPNKEPPEKSDLLPSLLAFVLADPKLKRDVPVEDEAEKREVPPKREVGAAYLSSFSSTFSSIFFSFYALKLPANCNFPPLLYYSF